MFGLVTKAALCLSTIVAAISNGFPENDTQDLLDIARSVEARSLSPSMPLRILPVGDSITVGIGSSDGNGYRLNLDHLLRANGNAVDFIGSHSDGKNNPDNQHEGFGGYRISGIMDSVRADAILNQQPNLVLLHAGTNDNDFAMCGEPYELTFYRLGKLLDFILCKNPSAVVLVAKVIQNKYHAAQTDAFNQRVPGVVADRASKGYKVAMVDMTSVSGDEMSDLLHPSDAGYRHMANLWYAAIQNVKDSWWTQPQSATTLSTDSCSGTLINPRATTNESCTASVDADLNAVTLQTSLETVKPTVPAKVTTAIISPTPIITPGNLQAAPQSAASVEWPSLLAVALVVVLPLMQALLT